MICMNVHRFTEYLEPRSLTELYFLVSTWGNRAKIIAGGTDLLVRMKQRTSQPEALISLQKIREMQEITSGADGITIGAAVHLNEIIEYPAVMEEYSVLAEAASKVGAYQHRYMGTIGGNLCLEPRCYYYNQSLFLRDSLSHCLKAGGESCLAVKGKKCYGVYSGDTAPALLALGAKAIIGSVAGERRIDLANLFSGEGLNHLTLQENEVLVGLFIGKEASDSAGVYLKLAERIAIDYPSLGVAATISLKDGRISRAALALTAAGSAPFAVAGAGNLAGAEEITEALLEPILEEATKRAVMLKNKPLSASYRRAMVKNMTRAALQMAWEKSCGCKGGCCSE
jgi:4-hydroxybenzoyl-CoA reductase subunit beta